MSNDERHKEQAAALLESADDPRIRGTEQSWELRFEALIHALLYVGDRVGVTKTTREGG